MKEKSAMAALILFFWVSTVVAHGPRHYVYQTNDPITDEHKLRPMNFGLTEAQRQDLYELSQGKVDLRHYYYSGRPLLDKKFAARLVDVLNPQVPPPVVMGTADPELGPTWWYEKLQLEKAWQLATGKDVVIADCDAGYATHEPDLASNLLLEYAQDFSNLDDPNTINDGPWMLHGTAVSAIMAGVKDGRGTNGIAYDAKVVPLQNFNYDSTDDIDKEEATARCILGAIALPQVKIVVLENQTENGSSETFAGTRDAVRLALMSGVTIVSAAGNYQQELLAEEKDDTGSIIVGALTRQGEAIYYTNYGKRVSIAAYGEGLTTLYGHNGGMADFGGTSGATPQVAATVALMLEKNSALTPGEIKDILVRTRQTSAANSRVGGLLDVVAAVQLAQATPPSMEHLQLDQFRGQVRKILAR